MKKTALKNIKNYCKCSKNTRVIAVYKNNLSKIYVQDAISLDLNWEKLIKSWEKAQVM